jgi:hypothetical protein
MVFKTLKIKLIFHHKTYFCYYRKHICGKKIIKNGFGDLSFSLGRNSRGRNLHKKKSSKHFEN